jgi:hypothetical protein
MFKRKNLSVALAVSSVLLASSTIANAEVANGTATVTVQNAFTLASTTNIDFGTLRVTSNGTAAATATPAFTTLDTDGTQVSTNGEDAVPAEVVTMTVIAPGTPGRVDVTGAAPFTALQVELASTTLGYDEDEAGGAVTDALNGINGTQLTAAGAGTNDFFRMIVQVEDTNIEGGTNNGNPLAATGDNLRTDAAGAVGLSFGGKLLWNAASIVSPDDGAYTGNYSITINY